MAWPQAHDYFEAIQDTQLCFRDNDLRGGQPAVNALGLPQPRSGNFADVYEVRAPTGSRRWAVKCFTRAVPDLQERYRHIGVHLRRASLPFLVDFQFVENGIRVGGQWYPVLKMPWVDGYTLHEFITRALDKPKILNRMINLWARLGRELRQARLAHGDLQHGNILLVPGSKARSLQLMLIDYDGMFVPSLAHKKAEEIGHPAYQHPQRAREGSFNAEVDRFSHLVIACALRALAVLGKVLWGRYDNGDNLLFREEDFVAPAASALFRELWQASDPAMHSLAGSLILACHGTMADVPRLDEFVEGERVRPLSAEQEKQVRRQMASTPVKVRQVPPPVPSAPAAGQELPAVSQWWEEADPLQITGETGGALQKKSSPSAAEPIVPAKRYKRPEARQNEGASNVEHDKKDSRET